MALETLHWSQGSAWLGQDLRQMEAGARLDSNFPAMSRARVWTNSFTMAEHIQQKAIAREGPLHSEEFFHVLNTVIQGEAPSHDVHFAQRLRDEADEELVTPLETFVAAAHREPDLAEELVREDEAAEAEVDEETPSPAQQRQLLRAQVNLGHPTVGEYCRALRTGRCRRGVVRWVKRCSKCPESEARPMAKSRPAALPTCYRFNQVCGIGTMDVRGPLDRESPIPISRVICLGTRYHQGARRQNMTATETFSTLRQFWLEHYDAMEVLITDQVTEFGADCQHLCQSRGILPLVTDLETPWPNSVVERHGALFKMAFEKACNLEAPTTEAEVNQLIDFTFAELNRRVGRAGFFAQPTSFWTTT